LFCQLPRGVTEGTLRLRAAEAQEVTEQDSEDPIDSTLHAEIIPFAQALASP